MIKDEIWPDHKSWNVSEIKKELAEQRKRIKKLNKKIKHMKLIVSTSTQPIQPIQPIQPTQPTIAQAVVKDEISEGDRVLVIYEENGIRIDNDTENSTKDTTKSKQKSCYIPYANITVPIPSNMYNTDKLCFKYTKEATIVKLEKERDSYCDTYTTYAIIEYYNPSRTYERVPMSAIYKLSDKDKADLVCQTYNFKVLTDICFNLLNKLYSMQTYYSGEERKLSAKVEALTSLVKKLNNTPEDI